MQHQVSVLALSRDRSIVCPGTKAAMRCGNWSVTPQFGMSIEAAWTHLSIQSQSYSFNDRPRQVQPQPVSVLMMEARAIAATSNPPIPVSHQ